jgi:hypothetical protein
MALTSSKSLLVALPCAILADLSDNFARIWDDVFLLLSSFSHQSSPKVRES